MTEPSPSLPFFGKQGKPLNRDSIRSKILGGEGGGLEGGGEPFSRRVPSPSNFPTTIYFPNVTRMSLSTNTSACMFLADGLRRGGGKLREDFVGIAL